MFEAPGRYHQNSTRRPPEREERKKFPAGERKKRAKFWVVQGRAVPRRGPGERPKNLEHNHHTHTYNNHQQAPPTSTTNKHHQQAPPTSTTNKHQQAPTGTNRHQQAPTGTNRHQQAPPGTNKQQPATTRNNTTTRNNNNNKNNDNNNNKIWPKH